MLSLYARIALRVGRRVASLLLPVIALYFLVVRKHERTESRRFLEIALGRPARLGDIYRHFHTFAQVVLDRVYLLAEPTPPVEIEVEGMGELERKLDEHIGCLLLGSHLGSFEASRILSQRRPEVPVRILMDREVNGNISRLLEELNPKLAAQLIDTSAGPAPTMLSIQKALDEGGLVAILGDRAVPGDKTTAVDFLGLPTKLPTAPYLMAAVTGVPVFLFFGFYLGDGRYRVVFELFSEGAKLQRKRRDAELDKQARAYAARLAAYTGPTPTIGSTTTASGNSRNEERRWSVRIHAVAAGHGGRGRRTASGDTAESCQCCHGIVSRLPGRASQRTLCNTAQLRGPTRIPRQ